MRDRRRTIREVSIELGDGVRDGFGFRFGVRIGVGVGLGHGIEVTQCVSNTLVRRFLSEFRVGEPVLAHRLRGDRRLSGVTSGSAHPAAIAHRRGLDVIGSPKALRTPSFGGASFNSATGSARVITDLATIGG